jgi:hypothetical protein
MNGHLSTPPRRLERFLERILVHGDWQSVTGDLREEYAEVILPSVGRFKANLWYVRQVASLAHWKFQPQASSQRILCFVSAFTSACCVWLAVMEWLLHRPGYLGRASADFSIALIPFLTIVAVFLRLGVRAERFLCAGAIVLIGIAVQAVIRDARSSHFEGFILAISFAFVCQGVLMLATLGKTTDSVGRVNRRTGGLA